MIRPVELRDLKEICSIYQEGINTNIATFETQAPTPEEWDKKFHPSLRFVYEHDEEVVGWISVTPISTREVYRGVMEVSVYLRQRVNGLGFGTQLLQHLKSEAKKEQCWMLQSSIFERNKASIRLHEKCDFRTVGTRIKIAKKHGVWENIVLMECHLQS